jgi:cytochrome c-type biogenesis protein CcmH/NrfG
MKQTFIGRVPAYITYLLFIIIPLLFISGIALDVVKIGTVGILAGIGLGAVIWQAWGHRISWPRGGVVWALLALVVILTASAVSSGVFSKAFFGSGPESTTVLFVLSACAAGIVGAWVAAHVHVHGGRHAVVRAYQVLAAAAGIAFLYVLIRMFAGADVLSFGLFSSVITTPVGRWTDVTLLIGVLFIMAVTILSTHSLQGGKRVAVWGTALLTLLFLYAANVSAVWLVVAVSMLFLALVGMVKYVRHARSQAPLPVSVMSLNLQALARRRVYIPLIIAVISIVAFAGQNTFATAAARHFNFNDLDVRPSLSLTSQMLTAVYKLNPFLGTGPNSFSKVFLVTKPLPLNTTVFWNADFSFGYSYVLTMLVTGGVLTLLAFLVLFVLFIRRFSRGAFKTDDTLVLMSIVLALYGGAAALLTVPSVSLLIITAVCIGLAYGLTEQSHETAAAAETSMAEGGATSRRGIGASVLGVVVGVCAVALLVYSVKQTVAFAYFGEGLRSLSVGDTVGAHASVQKAATLGSSELFYQAQAEITAVVINKLFNDRITQGSEVAKMSDTDFIDLVQRTLQTGIQEGTRRALAIDPDNYQNFVAEAHLAETILPLKVQDAYTLAAQNYEQAIRRNPTNPALYVARAQLETTRGASGYADAKRFLGGALQLKPNYSDAIFLLSQIQVAEGSVKDAITSVEVLSQLNPQEPAIFFQLGLLRYNNSDFTGTVAAMARAIDLAPSYSNARYFLGLSLARLGKMQEALEQFQAVKALNPDNRELDSIIGNLQAGRSPFAVATPAPTAAAGTKGKTSKVDAKPEKRKTLPVRDSIDRQSSPDITPAMFPDAAAHTPSR